MKKYKRKAKIRYDKECIEFITHRQHKWRTFKLSEVCECAILLRIVVYGEQDKDWRWHEK